MIGRTAWRLVRWLAGLAAVLAILAGFVVWRMSLGPLSLDLLAPYVASALSGVGNGFVVRVDHTSVRLEQGATIEILAEGVHLARQDGEARLTLPEISLGLSFTAALRGVIAPTRIALMAPALHLERAMDGTFHLGLDDAPAADDATARLLRGLAVPPSHSGPLGHLVEVAVRDAALTVADRALGVVWRAKRADATLFRGADGISGDLALVVEQSGGVDTDLHGDFRYIYGDRRLRMDLEFTELSPAVFAGAAPPLAPLAALELPLTGQFRLEIDVGALRISDAWCDVSLGAGYIAHPALEGGRVAVLSGRLRAAYDPSAGRVTLDGFEADLGGPHIEVDGQIDGLGADMLAGGLPEAIDLAADLRLTELPVNDLPRYWPEQLSPRTRSWIEEHIHDGDVGATAHIGAHVTLERGAAFSLRVETIAGTLDYRGLTVEYFKPLPPLSGVDGTATFDRARLDLVPSTGMVKGVHLTGGTAKLSKLDTDDEEIAIDLGLRGPLRDTLEVLDSKPLRYAHELKIDPSKVAGQVDGRLNFTFPLKHDINLDMVNFGAQAALKDISVGQILFGRDLDEGELDLKLDRAALRLDGTARLAQVPMTLSWLQSLKARDATRTRYTVRARLEDAARRRLDLDFFAESLKGPVDIDLNYALTAAKRATATLSLDLKEAAIDLAMINWHKPAGAAAKGVVDLDLVDDRLRAVPEAVFKGAGIDAKLSAAFGDVGGTQGITRVDISRLIVGESDVTGTISRRAEGGWRVEMRGLSFDASGLLGNIGREGTGHAVEPPLAIDAVVGRLILGPKREARDVTGQLYSDGTHWQAIAFDATLFGGGKASLRFGQAGGDRNFRLAADDFGAFLRLFDISSNVSGGQLVITGQVEEEGDRKSVV